MAINNTVENINNQPTIEPRTVTGIFTKYIAKTLPLAFDESMSYYECLCALLEYLNNTIVPDIKNVNDGLSELQTFYKELQSYVNDYFDNLDVQEEINNKLDQLVLNGTLTTLIGNYIQPLINEQNLRITSVENELSSIANGSPLVASSISDMTDTTRTYVNTTDGKWYYYDGDSWEIGGTYQSSGIGKNEITLYNLDSYINNSVDGNYVNFDSITYATNKYLYLDGTEVSSNNENFVILSANLNGGERLKLKTSMLSNFYGTSDTAIYVLYDGSDNVIEVIHDTLESELNVFELDVNVPNNCRKIKVNTNANRICYITKATSYKEKHKIGYDDLDSILKNKFKLIYNTKLTPTTYISNAYLQVNNTNKVSLSSANGYKVLRILLTPGKKYLLKNLIGFYSQISYAIGSNITRSISINDVSYNINLPGSFYKSDITGSDTLLEDQYITAPSYATYMYINISNTNQNLFEVYEANSVNETIPFVRNDILYGKKYVACGDSFTHGDFTGYTGNQDDIYDSELEMYKTYPYWIGKRNNMTVINEAINGSIMALSKEYIEGTQDINYAHPFSYQRYQEIPNDADYITIMFGLNDMYHTNLGTISDTTNDTFYGAINVVLSYLIEHHPDAKIGVIVSNAYLSDTYRNALKEVSIKWGVGYLDLYNDPSITKTLNGYGMSEDAITLKNSLYYVSNDNHHPNIRAHKIMSEAIENFLRKL